MTTLLALSIAIIAGLVVSRFIKLVHMPNVTAFLIGGLLIGPSVLGILSQDMTDSLSIITEAALGFIAYSIGAEFKLSYLKRIGTKPVVITICEGLGAVLVVDIVLIILSLCGVSGFDLPMCITLGAIASATAPAATLMVIRQYKAKGPVCEMLLPVVAMDDALGPDGLCHLHQRGAGHGQRRAHDRGQYGADPAGRDRRFAGAGHGHRLCAEPVHELLPLPGQQAGPDHCRHLSGAGPVRPVGAVQSALHHDDRRGHDQRLQDRERGHRADPTASRRRCSCCSSSFPVRS